jgi:Rrf2 family protein
MKQSAKVRYALLALLQLASHHGQEDFLQIDQIAADQQIPERYLAQLLMTLRGCGLVRSQRGAKGGYSLARAPAQITMFEVLVCLEGTPFQELSSQTESRTMENFAIAQLWQEANMAAIAVFKGYTLQDLCDKRDEGQKSNSMYYI